MAEPKNKESRGKAMKRYGLTLTGDHDPDGDPPADPDDFRLPLDDLRRTLLKFDKASANDIEMRSV